ncbi:MAG TPA: zinc-ribbon domain-containing protein [Bacteroidales bacterium]|nr:zinc-ribbon domain-containing protein [Bacteroidales bacterium]
MTEEKYNNQNIFISMSTIKCNKCNKPVESSDKFCPHCGVHP